MKARFHKLRKTKKTKRSFVAFIESPPTSGSRERNERNPFLGQENKKQDERSDWFTLL
jgi:hypothetical protein